jgi:hypothetical protein
MVPAAFKRLDDVVAHFTLPVHFMLQTHFAFSSMKYIHHILLVPIIGQHTADFRDHENGRIVLPPTFLILQYIWAGWVKFDCVPMDELTLQLPQTAQCFGLCFLLLS